MWDCGQLFHRKLPFHLFHLKLPLRLRGLNLGNSETSLEIFALSLLLLVSGTLVSDTQGNLPLSWTHDAFSIRLQIPTQCAEKWFLAALTPLKKGKIAPALSQAVSAGEQCWRDGFAKNGCQSLGWGQCQQGARDAFGDMIFSPAYRFLFPLFWTNDADLKSSVREQVSYSPAGSSSNW